MDIKGHTVHKVMMTVTADIAEEYYFSYLLDRANRTFLCIASVAGGMDIEQVADETPEKVAKVADRRRTGASTRRKAREIVTAAGFPAEVADQVVDIAVKLWQAFVAEDATLVEVNPLAKTADGKVLCLDAKVTLDENAAFRHPRPRGAESTSPRSTRWSRPPRRRTSTTSSSTARSASSATAPVWSCRRSTWSRTPVRSSAPSSRPTSSTSAAAPAPQVMANGLEIVLSDPAVKSVFVNVFGGITACDAVANGIVQALGLLEQRGEEGHQAAGRAAGRQQRRGGAARSSTGAPTRWSSGWTQWTVRPSGPPSWPRRERSDLTWLSG